MNIEHKDNGSEGAFYLEDNGSVIGQIDYTWYQNKVMVITHTEVNPEYENQGLGKKLVDASYDYAKENGYKILPICPFAKDVMLRSPKYADVLVSADF